MRYLTEEAKAEVMQIICTAKQVLDDARGEHTYNIETIGRIHSAICDVERRLEGMTKKIALCKKAVKLQEETILTQMSVMSRLLGYITSCDEKTLE